MSTLTRLKRTFAGGVHPPTNKELTRKSHIVQMPAVKKLFVMLSQHIGTPCQPLVSKGEEVEAGQKIGDCDAFVCSPVHSPVKGKVKEISLQSHPVLGRSSAVIIETDPSDQKPKQIVSKKFKRHFNEHQYSAEQICNAVRQAGIVGMGGAGFPTRVKIEPNPRLPKHTMIVNGCECEPYITSDYRIMLEWPKQIVAGIKLAQKASGCSKVFICIEDNKPKAIKIMKAALKDSSNAEGIKVVMLKTKYPQGGERQLIEAVLGKNVPTGGIPPMIGVLALNVATCAAIAEAVVFDTPLTHRVVTVTGKAIARPGNYYVPIGTPISELLDFCGSPTEKVVEVVIGGPMMGISIADLSTPVTKTTGAVTILPKRVTRHSKFTRHETACIKCGRCLEVCPENLNPTQIAHAIKNSRMDIAENYYLSACIECGCCSYICPANIELAGYIKTGKISLARQKQKMPG